MSNFTRLAYKVSPAFCFGALMSKDKILLAQLIKSWAQDHNPDYLISDPDGSDDAMNNTAAYLTWVIKQTDCNLDLLSLLDRLDVYMARRGKRLIKMV
jgi:hypothetical protein